MRTIITFFAVIATLNATARVGSAYWNNYQLQDTVEGIITFGGVTPPETLQQQVIDKAERLDVVLDYEEVTVTREGPTTTVDASYTKLIEVFPRYVREFRFQVHASSVYTGMVPFGRR
jgi:hypothetical protein